MVRDAIGVYPPRDQGLASISMVGLAVRGVMLQNCHADRDQFNPEMLVPMFGS
jgi:hypothetical protein